MDAHRLSPSGLADFLKGSQKQITRMAAPAKSRDNGFLPSRPHMFLYHVS